MIKLSTVRMTSPLEVQIVENRETTALRRHARKTFKKAIAEVDRLSALLSEYDETSEISQINQNAGQQAVSVSDDTWQVIQLAMKMAVTTSGAFDPTFRPLLNLWDYNHPEPVLPSDDSIQQALALTDYQQVELNVRSQTVRLRQTGMKLGLGGVSKGYIVQAIVNIFRSAQFENFLVNAGGDLFASGTHLGKHWQIGVPDPLHPNRMSFTVPVQNAAFCTSACYERFVVIDGKRFGHIIHPKTGYPVEYTKGVSVIAHKMAYTDAIATTIFVLGPIQGLAFANHLPDTEAIIFDKDGKMAMTQGLL